MATLRVLVADDHEIVRKDVCALITSHAGWEVCGEASDGGEAMQKVAQLKPDIVILDIDMPCLNGVEAIRQILHHNARQNIVILSVAESQQKIQEVLKAGARAYVSKSDAAQDLIIAVEELQRNGSYLNSRVGRMMSYDFLNARHQTPSAKPSVSPPNPIRTKNRTALGGGRKYKGDRQSSSGGLTARRLTVMKPPSDFPAEHKSSLQRRGLWAGLLLTVLVLGWIQTNSLLRRQHKLIRLSPRHLPANPASFDDPKSRSVILKAPVEDPRLLPALLGHSDAQYELGVAYARGQGVQSDYTVASTWLILAMANGERRSDALIRQLTPKLSKSETGRIRWNLGEMYANGFGVQADKVTAYMWHCLAEAAGENRSRRAKYKLALTMTRGEVSDANARASAWLRRHRLSDSTFLPVTAPSPRRHQM
jgi:DNA-binding NarL/FixJ family response regulator